MFIVRVLFLTLLLCCFNVQKISAAENAAALSTHNTFTQELTHSSQAYKIAKSTFLPETYDDLGLSGRYNTKYDFNKNDCSGYQLPSCPTGANCVQCPFNKRKYRINSCSAPYISGGSSCVCPPEVTLTASNEVCTKYCDKICIEKGCNVLQNERDCSKGFQSCDNGCGQNTRQCCVPCVDLITTKPANSSFNYSTCIDGNGQLKIKSSWSCVDGYHKVGETCVKDCNATNCTGYTLTSCPANGTCSSCTKTASNCSTDGTKYKLDSCASGYTKSGDSCIKAPATCQEYISQNNISGITLNSFTTTYLSGTYKGPKSVNYSKCKEMANPVITVTQPLDYAYFSLDNVDLVFNVPQQMADEECERLFSRCSSYYMNDYNAFKTCMDTYSNDYCYAYDKTSCCPQKRVMADANVSNVTLKDSNVTTSLGLTTGRTSGTITIYGNTKITGNASTYTSDENGHSYYGGSIIIKEGANANISRTECYKGMLKVEKEAILTTDAMGNNYQGGKDKNTDKSVQVYGTMKAKSFFFVNGPAVIHEGGFLAMNTIVKGTASSTYEGRVYYKPGAKLQIGSTCKSTSSTGSFDLSNKSSIPTSPPSAFTAYCSPVSY